MEEWRCCGVSNDSSRDVCRKCGKRDESVRGLKSWFAKVVAGEKSISSEDDARHFFRAMLVFTDKVDMVFLATKRHRRTEMSFLRDALSKAAGVAFYNQYLLPLFQELGRDEFSTGLAMNSRNVMLKAVYNTPRLLGDLADNIMAISKPELLAWFVHCLACIEDQSFVDEVRKNEDVLFLAEELCSVEGGKYRHLLERLLKSKSARVEDTSLTTMMEQAGGRHDNDFHDFRSVSIIPTASELNCDKAPFLPSKAGGAIDEWSLIDRQFRLLREDFVGPLREEVALATTKDPKVKAPENARLIQRIKSRSFKVLKICGLLMNKKNSVMIELEFEQPKELLEMKLSLKDVNESTKIPEFKRYWEGKKRLLSQQSLCAILHKGDLLCFASVAIREIDDLAQKIPVVCMILHSNDDQRIVLPWLGRKLENENVSLVQMSASIFAFYPVLERLQEMEGLPFASEFLRLAESRPLTPYFRSLANAASRLEQHQDVGSDVSFIFNSNKSICLDPSQRGAIICGLSKPVALIQGPPGTGKSFCGSLIAKAILSETAETILVVCYTNHALDQFLEELMDIGVPETEICRLGGSAKISARLQPLTISSISVDREITNAEKRIEANAFRTVSEAVVEVSDLEKEMIAVSDSENLNWKVVKPLLQRLYPDLVEGFQVRPQQNGALLVGKGKKKTKHLTESSLWKDWLNGRTPVEGSLANPNHRAWNMNKKDRKTFLQQILDGERKVLIEKLIRACHAYDAAVEQLQVGRRRMKLEILQNRRVIGCTTTGAAKFHKEILASRAGVLLVEEAGEVLEAHILSCLTDNIKQVIMIGDHKQLRPKVNTYSFTVESGRGHDFNRSLFERLILGGLPFSTLELQHRMRPEISTIIRKLIYPSLRDDKVVLSYPNVMGLQKNLCFVNHSKLEGNGNMLQTGDDGLSKVNLFEAKMVCSIANYLIQQGYGPSELVILTPYLGQLATIREELSKQRNLKAKLGKRDVADLLRAGEDAVSSASMSAIRIATVDNFQGEEANVVLLSLVRSNGRGDIGFLRESERVNVMLSRARHGMIIIGNANTLTRANSSKGKEIWSTVINILQQQGSFFEGFPIQCPRHSSASDVLDSPEKFQESSPNGGCKEPCGFLLACGHACPLKCHRMVDHKVQKCAVTLESTCPKGHILESICGEKIGLCAKKVSSKCSKGHTITYVCHKGLQNCKTCSRIEKDKMMQEQRDIEALEERSKKDEAYFVELEQSKREKASVEAELRTIEDEKLRRIKLTQTRKETDVLRQTLQERQKSPSSQPPVERVTCATSTIVVERKATEKFTVTELVEMDAEELLRAVFVPIMGDVVASKAKDVILTSLVESNINVAVLQRAKKMLTDGKIGDACRLLEKQRKGDAEALASMCRAKLGNPDPSIGEKPVVSGLSSVSCYAFCCTFYGAFTLSRDRVSLGYWALLYGVAFLRSRKERSWESEVESICKSLLSHIFSLQEEQPTVLDCARKWQIQVSVHGASSEAMSELVEMIGLEDVKQRFLEIHAVVDLEKQRSKDPEGPLKKRFHARFAGNPGTGKTTCARLYGRFLADLGALKGSSFQETTGAKLVNDGVPGVSGLISSLKESGGGTLFVDEAYQLNPITEPNGRRVLDYLLGEMESWIGEIVVIFAGYRDKLAGLMEHNEGLPSRFAYSFDFADYTDAELTLIMRNKMKSKFKEPLLVDQEKSLRILIRRIGRMRGKEGFGNARAVEVELDRVLERQAARIKSEKENGLLPNPFLLIWEDMLGPSPVVALESSMAWKELSGMIGLEKVKESLRQIVEVVKTNTELEKQELPLQHLSLNRCFLGSPGVGKTTVGKLYAMILRDLGLLSKGELHVKTPSDFVGSVLGESEKKSRAILKAAIGSVLLIDEAYGLYSKNDADPYRKAVIDTIVAEVQNVPGDDQCLIMCGYQSQMEEMMRNANPGLARRMSLDNAFVFDDFSNDELQQILNQKLSKLSLSASWSAQQCAVDVLAKQRRRRNFGNGGAVATLISSAMQRMNQRLQALPVNERAKSMELKEEDFDPDISDERIQKMRRLGPTSIFADLIGCQNIREKMTEYAEAIALNERKGKDRLCGLEFNFRFVGSPGTGKTTVARRMGLMFHLLGVLASDQVVCVSAAHLIGQYVGQTAPKTREKMEEALGCVLFIDEAYRLCEGPFAKEAVDELVNLLTEPQFYQKVVVILAGYEKEIDELMRSNPGLDSRFPAKIVFQDFSATDCFALLKDKLAQAGLEVSDSCRGAALKVFDALVKSKDWGNGRDVGTLANDIQRASAHRILKLPEKNDGDFDVLLDSEVLDCLTRMKEERQSRISTTLPQTPLFKEALPRAQNAHPNPSQVKVSISSGSSNNGGGSANVTVTGPPDDAHFIEPILEKLKKCLQTAKDEEEKQKLQKEVTHLQLQKQNWAQLKEQSLDQLKHLQQLEEQQKIEEQEQRRLEEMINSTKNDASARSRLQDELARQKETRGERQRLKDNVERDRLALEERRRKEIEKELERQR